MKGAVTGERGSVATLSGAAHGKEFCRLDQEVD